MSKLNDKVAIVTGASKGIGASIARHLADEGAAVVVNYASSKESGDHLVAEIIRRGGKAITVQANVAKQADIERLFSEAKRAFGRLDILVNNAGIYESSPLEGVTEEHFHKQFDLNVLGPLLATKEAIKHFGPAGGSVINISSIASTLNPAEFPVYSATKAARSEEHTSELQSRLHLVCRLLLEKKKKKYYLSLKLLFYLYSRCIDITNL